MFLINVFPNLSRIFPKYRNASKFTSMILRSNNYHTVIKHGFTRSIILKRSIYSTSSEINDEELLQRSLTSKLNSSYNESFLRCSIFDKEGHIKQLSTDIKRRDLISKYSLLPRDIRKINYHPKGNLSLVPYISVRDDFILVNFLRIRALIKSDCVILFDSTTFLGNLIDYEKSRIFNELLMKLRLQDSDLPYELRALEAILIIVTHSLTQEIKVQENVIKSVLSDLENHIHTENLQLLLSQNKKIAMLCRKATLLRDTIDDVLEQDEVLSGMYLTEPRLSIQDHAEVEILLETYYKHFDESVQIVEKIINNIKTTQEIINIILDSNRNQLMLLGLRFSLGIMFLGCSIYIASVYGMNLENFIEEDDLGFIVVVGGITIISLVLFLSSLKTLHKLEKIAISGKASMPKNFK